MAWSRLLRRQVVVVAMVASGCGSSTADETSALGSGPKWCHINDVNYAAGAVDPANPCMSCQPKLSASSWTVVPDGTSCHEGPSCTLGGTCEAGTCELTGPTFTIGSVATAQNTGQATVAQTADECVAQTFCSVDGIACSSCSATGATCGELSAGNHVYSVYGIDPNGAAGPVATTTFTVTFGPNEGRAIIVAHDFPLSFAQDVNEAGPIAILRNAVQQAPYKHQGSYERPLRIVGFREPTASATEVLNALTAIVGLYDTTLYREFSNPSDLAAALRGADVLLVYDQQDPPINGCDHICAVGQAWHDQLHAFLDAGGVVVVLDGFVTSPPVVTSTFPFVNASFNTHVLDGLFNAAADVSSTNLMLAGANVPGEVWGGQRQDDLDDILYGDVSALSIGSQYTAPVVPYGGTVVESNNDLEQPRDVYQPICLSCVSGPPLLRPTSRRMSLASQVARPKPTTSASLIARDDFTVAEKVFPVYLLNQLATDDVLPAARLDYAIASESAGTIADTTVGLPVPSSMGTIDCAASQLATCSDPISNGCDCTSGVGQVAACSMGADGSLQLPYTCAGTYEVDMRVKDVWNRPGRGAKTFVTIEQPYTTILGSFDHVVSGRNLTTICYSATVSPARALYLVLTFPRGAVVTPDATLSDGCAANFSGATGSFTFAQSSCYTFTVHATDAFANASSPATQTVQTGCVQ